jgi:hypothetical protein
MIDCDRCKQSYYKAAVSNDSEPFFWEAFASDLQSCAGDDGWRTAEEVGGEMICDECVEKETEELENCAELCF